MAQVANEINQLREEVAQLRAKLHRNEEMKREKITKISDEVVDSNPYR
jgi:hypothetical protein